MIMEKKSINNRKIIVIIISIIVISASMYIFINHIISPGQNITQNLRSNSIDQENSISKYLSNITVKLSIEPSFISSDPNVITSDQIRAKPFSLDGSISNRSFSGAVVELFANPSYISEKYNNNNSSFYNENETLPMTVTFVNRSWNAIFKLPKSICNITRTWRDYFSVYRDESTSMIISITYIEKAQSNLTTSFFYTGAVSYNPFLMKSGYTVNIEKHPYIGDLPYSQTQNMKISNTTTIYPAYITKDNDSPKSASTEYIPTGPGGGNSGCRHYWGWVPVKTYSFLNQPIPFVYVNSTEAKNNTILTSTLSLGGEEMSAGFTLSTSYFNVSGRTSVMGNTPTYETPNGFTGTVSRSDEYNQSQ